MTVTTELFGLTQYYLDFGVGGKNCQLPMTGQNLVTCIGTRMVLSM